MQSTQTNAEAMTAKDHRYLVTKYFYDGILKGITLVDESPIPFAFGFITRGNGFGSNFIVLKTERMASK